MTSTIFRLLYSGVDGPDVAAGECSARGSCWAGHSAGLYGLPAAPPATPRRETGRGGGHQPVCGGQGRQATGPGQRRPRRTVC